MKTDYEKQKDQNDYQLTYGHILMSLALGLLIGVAVYKFGILIH